MQVKIKILSAFFAETKGDPSLSKITLGSTFVPWANWFLPPVQVTKHPVVCLPF
jgi:hypothetical protein